MSQTKVQLIEGINVNTSAPADSLVIDSSGRVAIGTTSPDQLLHIASTAPDIRLSDTDGGYVDIDAADANLNLRADQGNTQASSRIALFVDGIERGRIDNSGKILVGTSTSRSNSFGNAAIEQLETTGADASLQVIRNSNNSAPPIVSFGKTRAGSLGGVTVVNDGDQLGAVNFEGADGSALVLGAQIKAEVEGTPGANDIPGSLVFSTQQSGASLTERMIIRSNGRLDSFATAPTYGFYLGHSDAAGTSKYFIVCGYSASAINTGTVSFRVSTNGNVQNTNNSYGAISDIKLKENIVDASSQWDDLKALQVRNYNFKEGQTHTQIGLIAQEAELVSPGLVSESPDVDEEGNDLGTVTKSVNYSVLYMKAVKALQEAMERIEQLESEMAAVKAQLS